MPSSTDDKCAKCGKLKTTGLPTITQWITACTCSLAPAAPQEEIPLCANCGKRVEKARAGSLTQWIFRSDSCSCDVPEQLRPDKKVVSQSEQDVESVEETEISVDEKFFPIDRYIPLEELGKGAAGVVYLCRDRLLHKRVAVKCLYVLTPEQLVSFQSEAKATSSLHHPNIVQVFDFGATSSGAPYMVMEYSRGVSLEYILNTEGTLDPPILGYIFDKVMNALEFAHSQGIFHRDIKPSNILFDEDSMDVRLIDFGVALAKQANQEPTIVQGKTIAGTPQYMSPDQIQGRPFSAGSDIYSLGCVIFECLTGTPPFVGTNALELLNKHASEKPPSILEFLPTSSELEHLDSVIARSLAKEPADRFNTVQEFRDAFTNTESDRTGQQTTSAPKSKRLKLIVSSVILIVISLSLFSFLQLSKQNGEVARERKRKPKALAHAEFANYFQRAEELSSAKMTSVMNIEPITSALITDESLSCLKDRHFATVSLSSTTISGSGLKYLKGTEIRKLDLSYSKLSHDGYKQLAKLKQIQTLDLSQTDIDDDELMLISEMPLRELRLQGCKNIEGGLSLSNMNRLRILAVSETKISPEALKNLDNLVDLDASASDEFISKILHLKKLGVLTVGGSKLTSKSLVAITKHFKDLQALDIVASDVDPMDLHCLSSLTKLNSLGFSGKPIDDKSIQFLGQLKRLRGMYLSGLKVTDRGIESLMGLNNLKRLVLSFEFGSSADAAVEKFQLTHPDCDVIQNRFEPKSNFQTKEFDLMLR